MKLLITIMSLFFAAAPLQAQDSWRIVMNSKLLISSHVSDEKVNVKAIKSSEWKKNGWLEVNYKETTKSSWHHTLRFTDEAGNELLVKENETSAKITLSSLRKLFIGKKQLKIYIVISPSDPMIMAPAYIIHLGTLKLP